MSNRLSRKGRLWTSTLLLLAPLVVAGATLLQRSRLNFPTRCKGRECTKLLRDIATQRHDVLAYGWVATAVLLLFAIWLIALIGRRPARSSGWTALEHDRTKLVTACMEVSDVVASEALRQELVDALAQVGVTPIDVRPGEWFDSSRYRAVGRVRTSDRSSHNRVARMERSGYVDHGKRLRYPEVVVFNAEGGAAS